MNGLEFRKGLKEGRYTSLGSYPRFLVMQSGALCWDCAKEERARIVLSAITKAKDRWAPLGFDVNWEDPLLYCDHCSQHIESAYAEQED